MKDNIPHTPEPWTVESYYSGPSEICRLFGRISVCAGPAHDMYGAEAANGQRIVACVNACAGIADPAELRSQRDELLSALKYMKEVGCEFYDMDMGENGCDALEKANAAIAKAEGRAQ